MFKKYSKTFKQLFSCLSLAPRSEANTSFHFTTFNFTFFSCWKFELGKICSKLKTRAKLLINQPNASIFSGCVPLLKTNNQFFVTLSNIMPNSLTVFYYLWYYPKHFLMPTQDLVLFSLRFRNYSKTFKDSVSMYVWGSIKLKFNIKIKLQFNMNLL